MADESTAAGIVETSTPVPVETETQVTPPASENDAVAPPEIDTVCVKHVGSFLVSSVVVEGITFEAGKCVHLPVDKAKSIIAKAAASGIALEIGQ